MQAVVDLNRLLPPEERPDPDSLKALQGNRAFRYLIRSLQRRYLELVRARQSNERGAYEFDAGVASGANEMLQRIDVVLAEVARTTQEETNASTRGNYSTRDDTSLIIA